MSMLYGGQIETMMPKLHSDNFEPVELIRPMIYVREKDIIHWCNYNGLQFIQCACKFTEQISKEILAGDDLTSKRKKVKELIAFLSKTDPQIEANIFRSTQNVNLAKIVEYKDKNGKRHNFLDGYDKKNK